MTGRQLRLSILCLFIAAGIGISERANTLGRVFAAAIALSPSGGSPSCSSAPVRHESPRLATPAFVQQLVAHSTKVLMKSARPAIGRWRLLEFVEQVVQTVSRWLSWPETLEHRVRETLSTALS